MKHILSILIVLFIMTIFVISGYSQATGTYKAYNTAGDYFTYYVDGKVVTEADYVKAIRKAPIYKRYTSGTDAVAEAKAEKTYEERTNYWMVFNPTADKHEYFKSTGSGTKTSISSAEYQSATMKKANYKKTFTNVKAEPEKKVEEPAEEPKDEENTDESTDGAEE